MLRAVLENILKGFKFGYYVTEFAFNSFQEVPVNLSSLLPCWLKDTRTDTGLGGIVLRPGELKQQ